MIPHIFGFPFYLLKVSFDARHIFLNIIKPTSALIRLIVCPIFQLIHIRRHVGRKNLTRIMAASLARRNLIIIKDEIEDEILLVPGQ